MLLVAAGILLAGSSLALPWVSYTIGVSGHTSAMEGGAVGGFLAAIGVAVVTSSAFLRRRPMVILVVCGGLGFLALVGSVTLALRSMAHANALTGRGPSQTSYAIGAMLGVAASLAVVGVAFTALGRVRAAGGVARER